MRNRHVSGKPSYGQGMSYFVTGTDTGVGKTLVSCALLHAFAAGGKRVAGFKPIACGCDDDMQNEDTKRLLGAGNVSASHAQVNPYHFTQPVAPHIAAANAGVCIDFGRIIASYRELSAQADTVIVEGVGGFRVPLSETHDTADLAVALGLPVIMVAGMRLGCLNHALLTVRAITDCGLECAAWVANVTCEDMAALPENIAALRQRIPAPLLGVIPFQPGLDPRDAAGRLNLEGLRAHGAYG